MWGEYWMGERLEGVGEGVVKSTEHKNYSEIHLGLHIFSERERMNI